MEMDRFQFHTFFHDFKTCHRGIDAAGKHEECPAPRAGRQPHDVADYIMVHIDGVKAHFDHDLIVWFPDIDPDILSVFEKQSAKHILDTECFQVKRLIRTLDFYLERTSRFEVRGKLKSRLFHRLFSPVHLHNWGYTQDACHMPQPLHHFIWIGIE